MKLIAVSAMSAVAMANDLESIWKNALSKPSSVEALAINQQMMRSSGDDRNVMDLFTLSNIFEYGCWCHFGDSKLPRGPVMDTVDAYCNRWWNSKDCIRIDNSNAQPPTTCDTSMQYVDVLAGLTFPFGPGNDYPSLCTAANTGQHPDAETEACAIDNCEVDAYFLRDTFTHMSFNHLNHSLSVSFGFDTDFTCRGLMAGGTTAAPFAGTTAPPETTAPPMAMTTSPIPAWDCCGSYPDRFPFRPQGGDRACCNGVTYSTLTLMCCPNGSTGAINSC